MAWYSPSRLKTYGQCRLQYRFRYLDKRKSAFTSAQAHFGTSVHAALERLYGELLSDSFPQVKDVIDTFRAKWKADASPSIRYIKIDDVRNPEKAYRTYLDKGTMLLDGYYAKHEPFDSDRTLRVEAKVARTLKDGSTVFGYVDRIAKEPDERIAIIDYKTGRPQSQAEADSDLQLGIYDLCLERDYRGQDIVLRWEYVTEDKVVESTRSSADLRDLEDELVALIAGIEDNTEWPASITKLCEYCGYNPLCPDYQDSRGFKVALDLPTVSGKTGDDPPPRRGSDRKPNGRARSERPKPKASGQSTLFDH